jgi:L-asparaginase / beta-aspartyl-peptidase
MAVVVAARIGLSILLVSIGVGSSPGLAQEATNGLTRDVAAVLAAQTEAWNRGDLEAFMATYWKSDQLTFSSGGATERGWQATLDRYRRRYPDRAAMGTLSFSDLEVTALGDAAALALGRWHLRREGGDLGGNFSLVLRRIDGAWKIVHDHTSQEP